MILEEPYIAPYSELLAVSSETADQIEYMEKTDCLGGMKWSVRQYAQSPLVRNVRIVGGTARYLLKTGNVELPLKGSEFPAGICGAEVKDNEITISFAGLGGAELESQDAGRKQTEFYQLNIPNAAAEKPEGQQSISRNVNG